MRDEYGFRQWLYDVAETVAYVTTVSFMAGFIYGVITKQVML